MLSQNQVDQLQDIASDRIEELLLAMGVEYKVEHHFITAACPVHGGDAKRGWFWAFRSQSWRCNTNGCQTLPMTGPSSSLFGLVRGAMSTKTDRLWSFKDAIDFVQQALGIKALDDNPQTAEDQLIAKTIIEARQRMREQAVAGHILLSDIICRLTPDTVYYPERGYSKATIAKYHISFCDDRKKPFYERAFFPVLDESGLYVVGWSARSMWDQCDECKCYHSPIMSQCPSSGALWAKWRHSVGFRAELSLYNLWNAKTHIRKTGTAVIVEGPGDVWALEEAGIGNAVAIMGLNLSKYQNRALQKAGALTLMLVCDNDKSGREGAERIARDLSMYFRVVVKPLEGTKDVGDMPRKQIRRQFAELLEQEEKA